jgi:FG-GAP-like repeat
LVAGDFDKDGNWDLAVVNETGASVSILLGNGDGTLKAQTAFGTTVGSQPSSITTGDFNRDGNLDLVVTNFNNFGGNTVSIYVGAGSGTFSHLTDPAVAQGPLSVIAADFNGGWNTRLGGRGGLRRWIVVRQAGAAFPSCSDMETGISIPRWTTTRVGSLTQ